MSESRRQELMALAVPARSLQADGAYTLPRSWAVYRVEPAKASSTRRFRLGNHPVREQELRREFVDVDVIARFTERRLAVELAALHNAGIAAP